MDIALMPERSTRDWTAADEAVESVMPRPTVTQRERELAAIIRAYNDVTERLKTAHERLCGEVGRLREQLAAKDDLLRRRERLAALGEMAAGLAHEIRNPLGGIALYASKLELDLTDNAPSRMAAGKISASVRSLNRLVTDILDFAQETRLQCRMHRLAHILNEAQEAVRPWASECGAAVMIQEAAGRIEVYCDGLRLRQVLVNLLMNAVQAAGAGGLVGLQVNPVEGSGIEFEVWDTGPGIPPEHLERIFNPFFTTRASGTGLGLAIVHRIVEAHGGWIRVANRPEGGARFTVRMPGGTGKCDECGMRNEVEERKPISHSAFHIPN